MVDVSISPNYKYRGLLASTWDLLRGDSSRWPDRAYYAEIIKQHGEPALDVGCGTGRLLLDYLGRGIDIDGVDNSPEMLALCRDNAQHLNLAPTLYTMEMQTLDLPRRYAVILVPSSSFQLLVEPRDAHEAVRRFFAHLQPGGVLVMPFMILWRDGDPIEQTWKTVAVQTRPEDGAVVRRQSRFWYDVENHLEHNEDCIEVSLNGTVVASDRYVRSPKTRWYTHAEAEALYREAGFVDVALYAAFTFEAAPSEIPLFAVIGRKAR